MYFIRRCAGNPTDILMRYESPTNDQIVLLALLFSATPSNTLIKERQDRFSVGNADFFNNNHTNVAQSQALCFLHNLSPGQAAWTARGNETSHWARKHKERPSTTQFYSLFNLTMVGNRHPLSRQAIERFGHYIGEYMRRRAVSSCIDGMARLSYFQDISPVRSSRSATIKLQFTPISKT